MCMRVLLEHVCMHIYVHILYPRRSEKGIRFSETEIADACKRALDLVSLQEQQAL